MIIRCFSHNFGEKKQSFSSCFHFYWSKKWKEMENNVQLYQLYRFWWDYFGKLTIYFGRVFNVVNDLFRNFRLCFPKWEIKTFNWNFGQIYCCWCAAAAPQQKELQCMIMMVIEFNDTITGNGRSFDGWITNCDIDVTNLWPYLHKSCLFTETNLNNNN